MLKSPADLFSAIVTFMRKFALALTVCLAPLWASGELSNRRAPGFALPDSNIKYHDLGDYRGKIVVLEIMLTNCPHCEKFAEILEEAAKKYTGRVQVLAIANPPDNTGTVADFIKAHQVSYPVLFDCGQVAGSYFMATPQKASFDIPHVFLIDGNGAIRNDFSHSPLTLGIFEGRGLFAEIEKLLAGSAAGGHSAPKK